MYILTSSLSDAQPGLGIGKLADLSLLTVVQLFIVVVGVQVSIYVIAASPTNHQSPRAI